VISWLRNRAGVLVPATEAEAMAEAGASVAGTADDPRASAVSGASRPPDAGAGEAAGDRPSFAAPGNRWAHALVRFGVLGVLVLTAVLYLPTLRGGFFADDWLHRLALDQLTEIFTDRINLFGMIKSSDEVAAFKHFGLLPWWASEEMRINFYRPLPSIVHWLEYKAFGHHAAIAHLVSIAFYVLSVYLVSRVLARFLPDRSAVHVLAVLIFALDDAHALNIAWIANRNETIGASLVLLSLLAFQRYREGRGRYHAPLTALAYALALLSKESALVLPLFVLAHALVFPDRPGDALWARLRPHLALLAVLFAISAAFLGLYFGFGHGANSVYYINPLRNPALWATQFFRSGFYHAVILATGVPLHILSSTPVHDYPLAAAGLGAAMLAFWYLAYRWLRHDRPLRFFLLTMAAGQAIVTTSFPDPRNLFLPSIGFAYMTARVLEEAWRRRESMRLARWAFASICGLHILLAPILDQACIYIVNSFEGRYRTLRDSLVAEVDYSHLPAEGMQVFFLNWHQREMSAVYGLYLRRELPTGVSDYTPWTQNDKLTFVDKLYQGLGAERIHYFSLSLHHGEVDARVLNDHEIELSPKQGHYFPTLFEQLYTTGERFTVGQTFETGRFRATIEEVVGDEVRRVRFTFPEPLSSSRYRFLVYDGERFVRAPLTRNLPAPSASLAFP